MFKNNFLKLSFLSFLFIPSFLFSQEVDFYNQSETFLIDYFSQPENFEKALLLQEPSPLVMAVDLDYPRLLTLLLELGMDINIKNSDGISPLLWAVFKNNNELTEILLSYGANPNNSDSKGWSPLMIASRNNNINITKLLVEAGAKIESVNFEGSSALFWASRNASSELFAYLLEEGANINKRNYKQQTVAHIASQFGQPSVLSYILEEEPTLAVTRDLNQETPIIKAVQLNRYDIIDILAPFEIERVPENPLGDAIVVAYKQGNKNMVNYLKNLLEKAKKGKSFSLPPQPFIEEVILVSDKDTFIKESDVEIISLEIQSETFDRELYTSLTSIPQDIRAKILSFLGIKDTNQVKSIKAEKVEEDGYSLWQGDISYTSNKKTKNQNFSLKIKTN